MNNIITIGKEYSFAGYKWIPVVLDKNMVVLQSLGVTVGSWPGFSMHQFGDHNYYGKEITGQDISAYDDKTKNLYEKLRSVEVESPLGKGLYLPREDIMICNWKQAMITVVDSDNPIACEADDNMAWLDKSNGSYARCFCANEDIGSISDSRSQICEYIIAPAFNLDLSKVEIEDDEIFMKGARPLWIIATCNSDGDGVWMDKTRATKAEIKEKMVAMVSDFRSEYPEGYVHGTEWEDEVEIAENGFFANQNSLNATAVFSDYHIDISAIRLEDIPECRL